MDGVSRGNPLFFRFRYYPFVKTSDFPSAMRETSGGISGDVPRMRTAICWPVRLMHLGKRTRPPRNGIRQRANRQKGMAAI